MTNADHIEKIAAANSLSKANAKKLVDGVFAIVAATTTSGKEVSLNGFGQFKVKDSRAREGRNPSTGESIQIAASKKISFIAAKALKDRPNG